MMQPLRALATGAIIRLTPASAPQHLRSAWFAHTHNSSAIPIRDDCGGAWWYSRPPARFLSTTIAMKAGHDSSSIDYVHPLTPTHNGTALPEITRVPLLPDTESPPPERKALDEEAIGRVIRPEISTVSGDGTHLDVPSAMSEVTDNHAAELDPYDLPSKVAAAASKRPNQATKKPEQPGSVKAVWNGLLDDIFGEKNPPKA